MKNPVSKFAFQVRNLRRYVAGPADEYAHMVDQCYTAKIEKYEYKVGGCASCIQCTRGAYKRQVLTRDTYTRQVLTRGAYGRQVSTFEAI